MTGRGGGVPGGYSLTYQGTTPGNGFGVVGDDAILPLLGIAVRVSDKSDRERVNKGAQIVQRQDGAAGDGADGMNGSHRRLYARYLASNMDKRIDGTKDDWGSKVANFLFAKISEAEFLTAAASTDVNIERAKRCQAFFYAGMKRLLDGDKSTAADYFRKCLATEVNDTAHYEFAQSELRALTQ